MSLNASPSSKVLLFTPSSRKCLVAVVIQQVIVASSIYFLTECTSLYTQGETKAAGFYLLSYMLALILPFLPGSLSLVYARRWKSEVVQKLSFFYSDSFSGENNIWLNKKAKEKVLSQVSAEMLLVADRHVSSAYSFVSVFFNVALSIVSLSLFLDVGLLPVYLFSVFLSYLVFTKTIQLVSQREVLSQDKRNALSEVLRRSWDALLLKNVGNWVSWKTTLNQRNQDYTQSESAAEELKQKSNLLLALTSFVPVFVYIGFRCFFQLSNTAFILLTLVNLPRVFMLMNHTYAILAESIELKSSRELWLKLLSSMEASQYRAPELYNKVSEASIQIQSDSALYKISDFLKLNLGLMKGLFTVKGPNGSGKSLFLLQIKEKYQDSCYFLPAHHDLFVDSDTELSSGQLAKRSIEWLHNPHNTCATDLKIILLDEWNANLDHQNTKELEVLIQSLSTDFLVVQVRHDEPHRGRSVDISTGLTND